ncbi:MAG TPA: Asp-tRNA(Asn)/Glu-tRNA(Gln) amidotransferase subunit GatC [Vicinamibacterales bacterium]|nr:Asp-tRNA(Asn)/Glu-tRNA(Gln) amidotransferase subunit GatC [Vicinamibacterales bacterium]
MAQPVSSIDVSAVAALANLDLDADELDLFAKQLRDVLEAVNTLAELDTAGVPPTAAILTHHPVDRPDERRPSLDRDAAVAAAPDASADAAYFRVPKVIG